MFWFGLRINGKFIELIISTTATLIIISECSNLCIIFLTAVAVQWIRLLYKIYIDRRTTLYLSIFTVNIIMIILLILNILGCIKINCTINISFVTIVFIYIITCIRINYNDCVRVEQRVQKFTGSYMHMQTSPNR